MKSTMAGSLQRLLGRLLPRLTSGGCWQSLASLRLANASLHLSLLFSHGHVPSLCLCVSSYRDTSHRGVRAYPDLV